MVGLGPFSQSLLVTLINQKLKLAVALGLPQKYCQNHGFYHAKVKCLHDQETCHFGGFHLRAIKQKIETVQKTMCRIWDMKGGKYAKIFAKIQDCAIFLCEILGKTDLPIFIELCMETPCWCPSGWAAHIATGN